MFLSLIEGLFVIVVPSKLSSINQHQDALLKLNSA